MQLILVLVGVSVLGLNYTEVFVLWWLRTPYTKTNLHPWFDRNAYEGITISGTAGHGPYLSPSELDKAGVCYAVLRQV